MPRRIWRPREVFLRFSDEEQELEKRNLVMYKRFIVLLGILLGSHAPAAAQTPAVQTPAVQFVLAHAYVAPAITILRPVSAPLPAVSFQEYQYPPKNPPPISITWSRGPTYVTTALSVFPRPKRLRLCFSLGRACRSPNSGADGCGLMAL
jgi:hypothetical protein